MPAFEMYDTDGNLRMSSTYPCFQYVSKEAATSFGSGVVTGSLATNWDTMQLAAHLKNSSGNWIRYLFDDASRLPLPAVGEPSLLLYDDTGTKVTFILKYPVMNILQKLLLGEPTYLPGSTLYSSYSIPMNGRTLAITNISASGPVTYTLHSTYTYHSQRYYNYTVTSYRIEPVFNYTTQTITFERKSSTYLSEGHTSTPQNSDNFLSLSCLIVDVTGL